MECSSSEIVLQLFAQMHELYNLGNEEENLRMSNESLRDLFISLSALLGSTLLNSAFKCIKNISEHRAKKCGRSVFWVKGKTEIYKVLPIGFCTCRSFQDRVGGPSPFCKHIIAVHLGKVQQSNDLVLYEDEDWGREAWGEID